MHGVVSVCGVQRQVQRILYADFCAKPPHAGAGIPPNRNIALRHAKGKHHTTHIEVPPASVLTRGDSGRKQNRAQAMPGKGMAMLDPSQDRFGPIGELNLTKILKI